MRLQLALDLLDENEALEVVRDVGEYFDIIEVGTSLLKLFGLSIVYKVKCICPDKKVFVDSKVIDGPEREATLMCSSGTDMFSMLACATDTAVEKVLRIAKENQTDVIFDMQSVPNSIERAKRLKEMGAKYLCIHKNSDCGENLSLAFREFTDVKDASGLDVSIAGGIDTSSLELIKGELRPDIVVIGGAVLKAKDRKIVAEELKRIASS